MSTNRTSLRILTVALIAVSLILIMLPLTREEAHAKVKGSVAKKAKTYKKSANKLFKVGKKWYCFSKKKVKTGLQKVGKEYYFFNKSDGAMLVKSGLRKVGSSYYFFNKKSGKAPALRNTAKGLDGSIWFFQSNGKRYKYSYLDTGSAAGNTAAGIVIQKAGIVPDGNASSENIKKAYDEIVKNYTYAILISAAPENISDIGKLALVMTDKKGGKCYNYAALTYVSFKALGAEPVFWSGQFQRNPGGIMGEHAWVTLQSEDGESYMYDTNQDSAISKGTGFYEKKITYQSDDKSSFTIDGQDYIYYPEKSI